MGPALSKKAPACVYYTGPAKIMVNKHGLDTVLQIWGRFGFLSNGSFSLGQIVYVKEKAE